MKKYFKYCIKVLNDLEMNSLDCNSEKFKVQGERGEVRGTRDEGLRVKG